MQKSSLTGVNRKGSGMVDARMKKAFQEAAEIAQGVPESLREAAFNRALDVLLGKESPSRAGAVEEDIEIDAETVHEELTRRKILGIPGSGFVLEKSVAALNMAAARLGMEEMSAEQIADTLEENFGVHVSHGVVAKALEQADSVVTKVREGGETLYRVIRPPMHGAAYEAEEGPTQTKSKSKAKPKAKAKSKSSSSGGAKRKAASKKKSTPSS